jgi:hypothetical protein
LSDLRAWLAGRTPAPPDALPLPVPEGTGDPSEQLTGAALAALERALAGVGERKGAFDLLAADGLLTYACERAVSAADPEAELLAIVERVAGGGGAGGS